VLPGEVCPARFHAPRHFSRCACYQISRRHCVRKASAWWIKDPLDVGPTTRGALRGDARLLPFTAGIPRRAAAASSSTGWKWAKRAISS
jgi:hypothetical protein